MHPRPLHDVADTPDPHDRLLIERVHPPSWRNPEPQARYHLVVLGGGTAGLVSAAGAAGLGARVALIEQHLMGGDCLVTGCVPSKALIHAADVRRAAPRIGASPLSHGATEERAHFSSSMSRLREVRAAIGVHDSAERFQRLGVDVFLGHGRFVTPDALEVDGRRLRFRRAVIATGSGPIVPEIPGLRENGFLTNETVFELRHQPESLLVLGGGPVGCELAQAFARLGTRVTLVTRGKSLLSRDEPDAADLVRAALERDGVRLLLESRLERVDPGGGDRPDSPGHAATVKRLDGVETIPVHAVLVATGRTPRLSALGLDAAGIDHGPSGLAVNDRLQTSNPRVFAAGDVALPLRFTHAADAMARLVIRNALFFGRGRASALTIPRCTYTSPELAHVGPTRADLQARGERWEEVEVSFDRVDRAVIDEAPQGFLRLLLASGTDRIVGGTIVGAHAGTLCGELSVAVTRAQRLRDLGSAVRPYPTVSEVFRKASDEWQRRRLTPFARGLLARWFRVLR